MPITLGDVNDDGDVSISDVTSLINYLLGVTSSQFNASAADVNNDGKVTVADVAALIDLILAN